MLSKIVFTVSVLAATALGQRPAKISFENNGLTPLGIYFGGDGTTNDLYHEALVAKLAPGVQETLETSYDHLFIVRSADFLFRMKVEVRKNKSPDRPGC